MKKTLFGSVLCGAAVLSAAVVFSSCGRAQINASDYVTIKFDGYDNYGTASARFDYVQMMQDNKEAFKLDKGGEMAELNAEVQLEENIDGKLDKTTELKNGDTVTYSWNNRDIESLEKNFKVKFTFEDKTETVSGLDKAEDLDPFAGLNVEFKGYDGMGSVQNAYFTVEGVGIELDTTKNGSFKNGDTVKASIKGDVNNIKQTMLQKGKNITKTEETFTVSGLEPIKDVDLFEYITVNFEGTSPNAKAVVKQKDGAPVKHLNFNVDKTESLANGDTIKVTLDGDYTSEGVKPSSTEKEYTVEGLPYYITELSQLPADALEKMKKNDDDIFNAFIAGDWENTKLNSKTYIGNYFVTQKENVSFDWGDSFTAQNKVYTVYKITATHNKIGKITYYWASGYPDIMILPDGTCSFDMSGTKYTSTVNQQYRPDEKNHYWTSYNGFKELDSLFSNLITTKIDKYTYENTVKEETAKKKKG